MKLELKTEKEQKETEFSWSVTVAAHVATATWDFLIGRACVLTQNRGKRRRSRALAAALLRWVSGEGEVTDGCGVERRRRWWCSKVAGRPRAAVAKM